MRFLRRILNARDTYYVQELDSGEQVVMDSDGHIVGDWEDVEAAQEESKDR
ncbi:hypothetical protein [Arthronema virus TR020]|uniref:Uncharacterized protein n=1 Tax=Arthronema virus TR020 TaxID=2736280 RepID=A0A7G3WH30_9CAUD|nr:hypothetical protein [Arthronema virus TR020]